MKAKLIETSDKELVLQVTVTLESGMLKTEESIQDSLNQAGCLATEIALSRFDTNGEPIMVNGLKYTTKGQIEKIYQTPYGEAKLPRHVYQGSLGGKTYCPLDHDARTIVYSTPKFAKSVSSKYASASSRTVHDDLKGNHGRYISRTYIKDIADAVGGIALDKEEKWSYAPPESFDRVETIGLGLDGTCMFMSEDGWRQAMVGTIAYFDSEGERLNTIYLSAAPEYGKSRFLKKVRRRSGTRQKEPSRFEICGNRGRSQRQLELSFETYGSRNTGFLSCLRIRDKSRGRRVPKQEQACQMAGGELPQTEA